LLDESSDGAVVIAADDRRILAMNPVARDVLGYSESEAIGCQCKKMLNSPACTISCPLTALLEGRKKDRALQLYYRGADGSSMLHARTRMLLVRGPDGTPLAGIELFRDLRETRRLQRELGARKGLHGIVGSSPPMQALYGLVEQVAPYDLPVLITGESGTGKERFADAIQHLSERAAAPFIKLNCAALSPTLVESELFGHKRGAFTGASRDRSGVFEEADGGTLFLDEVGELALPIQAKLLRTLQEGEVTRVGEDRVLRVDVRVIAATNRDLPTEIAEGRFREDLYYRLAGVTLALPPLRERLEDVPALVDHLLGQLRGQERRRSKEKRVTGITPAAVRALSGQRWRGNVRELVNVLRLAWIRTPGGTAMGMDQLGLPSQERVPAVTPDLEVSLAELEEQAIRAAMERHDGNMSAAARALGVDRSTLWRKWKRLQA
jgi:transcriptional regulator with PAS, ATPase and Fis domain